MRIYLDTCIIIDYLAKREPFFNDAEKLLNLIADNKISAYVSSSSVTDLHYIIKHYYNDEAVTKKHLLNILYLVSIIDTLSYNIKTIFDSPINDFEHALIEELAYQSKLDYIVTRNTKDFKKSRVKVLEARELINIIYNEK